MMTSNKAVYRFRQAGVSMMETMLVMPIMLIIGFGIVHGGLVYQAQANLEYAALMAARVGAASSIDVAAMQQEAEYRMRATTGIDGNDADEVTQVRDDIQITVLNPTQEMFFACGEQPINDGDCLNPGSCELPYFGMQFYNRNVQNCNGVNIQDANILRIRLSYTYNSRIPFLNRIRLVGEGDRPEEEGVEITAVATVRMQSPARLTVDNESNIASSASN